ncbi:MAG: hybrid sensor histidine kinase/response regulator [Arcobacteraceae bacterium]|nr:hybrid sensor histidine kinase/response regulator [Arcobacteraceae bacterium]
MKEDLKKLKNIAKDLTVLYAEDDGLLRVSVYEYLKKIFKKVVCAEDGEHGLDLFKKAFEESEYFDIVITDIEMPNMNGLEMSKNIKNINSNQEIIIISAYTSVNYFTDSIQIGVSGYIIKPMDYLQMNSILYKTALRIQEHKKVIEYEKYLEKRVKEEVKKNKVNQKMLLEQSKMAAMGEMLESIAHQWRQPLSVITTAASGMKMQKEFDMLTDELFVKSVDSIVSAAMHLSDTIDDFRDFFNPNKKEELFNLKDSFYRATELLSSKFKNREIETIENIDDVEMMGLTNDLVQVFMNILNNAKDALEEVKDKKRLIFVEINKDKNNINILIKDSGGGIPDNIIDKIFESHFTTKENKDGTGIGLYMTQQIIKDHLKGKIDACNVEYEYDGEKYKGAQFSIKLPLN